MITTPHKYRQSIVIYKTMWIISQHIVPCQNLSKLNIFTGNPVLAIYVNQMELVGLRKNPPLDCDEFQGKNVTFAPDTIYSR
jgi:hypothetical protein